MKDHKMERNLVATEIHSKQTTLKSYYVFYEFIID